jgi:hypothetical protein
MSKESSKIKISLPGSQKQKQLRPGTHKSTKNINPFRPTNLQMVLDWLENGSYDSFIKGELIKMAKQQPHGALDHFVNHINHYIDIAHQHKFEMEG